MTGEITLSGQVFPVGGIKEKVLVAHRCGQTRVNLPQENCKQVDEEIGDDLRRAVTVDYVTQIDELLTWRWGARCRRTVWRTRAPRRVVS